MQLTPKQREVAKHLKAGLPPAEVAHQMGIQQTTLRMHMQSIKRFYETVSYQEAIEKARGIGDI